MLAALYEAAQRQHLVRRHAAILDGRRQFSTLERCVQAWGGLLQQRKQLARALQELQNSR